MASHVTPSDATTSETSEPTVTWPNIKSRCGAASAGASQNSSGANWLRSSSFSACCRRSTSGHCADRSRPIPSNWFPDPG